MLTVYVANEGPPNMAHVEITGDRESLRRLGEHLIEMAGLAGERDQSRYSTPSGGGPPDGELAEQPRQGWTVVHWLDIRREGSAAL